MKLARVYPIVDSAAWVKRLAPLGVRLVQLRIKEQPDETLLREIREARACCVSAVCSSSSTTTGSSRSPRAAISFTSAAGSGQRGRASLAARRRALRCKHAR